MQPSSIDVRLDRYFRVFANHRYTHIDPAEQQDDLTELVEPRGDEPFILHPGEFVLGSTLEVISLGDDLAARLEGKALALDTEVPTPVGLDDDGVPRGRGRGLRRRTARPTTVVAATDVLPDRACYEVVLSDGSRFIADAQHQWVTRPRRSGWRGAPRAAQPTTEEIAETLRVGREWNHHIAVAGPAQYADRARPADRPVRPGHLARRRDHDVGRRSPPPTPRSSTRSGRRATRSPDLGALRLAHRRSAGTGRAMRRAATRRTAASNRCCGARGCSGDKHVPDTT